MENLMQQLAVLDANIDSLVVLFGKVVIGVCTAIEFIKYAKEMNVEKACKSVLVGVLFLYIMKLLPKLLN